MLFGDLVDGGRVTVDIVDDKLDFTIVEIPKPLTKEEREQKVYRLCHELEEMKQKKKASSRGFSEEIKRIEDEIKDLLDPVSLEE